MKSQLSEMEEEESSNILYTYEFSNDPLLNQWICDDLENLEIINEMAESEIGNEDKAENSKNKKKNTTNVMLPVFTGGALKVKEKSLPVIKNSQIFEMEKLLEKRMKLEQDNKSIQNQIIHIQQKNQNSKNELSQGLKTYQQFMNSIQEKQQAIEDQIRIQQAEEAKRKKERIQSKQRIEKVKQSTQDLKIQYTELQKEVQQLEDQLSQICLSKKLKISELNKKIKEITISNQTLSKQREEIERMLISSKTNSSIKK